MYIPEGWELVPDDEPLTSDHRRWSETLGEANSNPIYNLILVEHIGSTRANLLYQGKIGKSRVFIRRVADQQAQIKSDDARKYPAIEGYMWIGNKASIMAGDIAVRLDCPPYGTRLQVGSISPRSLEEKYPDDEMVRDGTYQVYRPLFQKRRCPPHPIYSEPLPLP